MGNLQIKLLVQGGSKQGRLRLSFALCVLSPEELCMHTELVLPGVTFGQVGQACSCNESPMTGKKTLLLTWLSRPSDCPPSQLCYRFVLQMTYDQ